MKYVGIDVHKLIIVLCVMNQERKVLERETFRCQDVEGIRAYIAKLGEFEAVVEATASYEWFAELVKPLAKRFVLMHPGKLRLIAESTRKCTVRWWGPDGRCLRRRGQWAVPQRLFCTTGLDTPHRIWSISGSFSSQNT